MKETILYGVLVYPFELEEYLESIVRDPGTFMNEFYLDSKTRVGNLIYHSTYGDEEDFYYLFERILDEVRFPYNYYPSDLDGNFVIYRLKEEKEDYGATYTYASFLEHKVYGRYPNLDDMAQMEDNWDNQVKLCLEHRVYRLLEE